MSMTLEQAKEKLAKYGQEHVLKYYGELNEEEKQGILDQIETTDMSILEACKHKEDLAKKGVILSTCCMATWINNRFSSSSDTDLVMKREAAASSSGPTAGKSS